MGSEQINAYVDATEVKISSTLMDISSYKTVFRVTNIENLTMLYIWHFLLLIQGGAKARAMGSMAIITSFVFLVDTVFNVLDMRNG